ncbi:MAG: ankyrin repeat domain-containing protein [Candidatus Protochlamydia sp.]|nr:ankyrin repeat domain-containing protein [Candidatus Protochlamydia sp.]
MNEKVDLGIYAETTPLMEAIENNDPATIELLINNGADIAAPGQYSNCYK